MSPPPPHAWYCGQNAPAMGGASLAYCQADWLEDPLLGSAPTISWVTESAEAETYEKYSPALFLGSVSSADRTATSCILE